jgi:anti-anti-sigma factor
MSADSLEPRLDVVRDGERTVVRFSNCNSLNEFTSDRVGQLLVGVASNRADQHVVLDMSNIQYLTSTVLGHLIVLHKRLTMGGGRLTIENVCPAVRDVFRVTLLDQVLDIRPANK